MESQVHVLELESNLEKERKKLSELRKTHYKLAGESEGWEQEVSCLKAFLLYIIYNGEMVSRLAMPDLCHSTLSFYHRCFCCSFSHVSKIRNGFHNTVAIFPHIWKEVRCLARCWSYNCLRSSLTAHGVIRKLDF